MTSTRRSAATTLAALAIAVGVGACAGSDDAGAPSADPTAAPTTEPADQTTDGSTPAETAEVGITRSRYEPVALTVEVGQVVAFTNNDPFAHTVTSNDAAPVAFASGDLGQDESFVMAFEQPGTYGYFCEIHPTMRATVTVE